MSDLTATNCGCNNRCGCNNGLFGGSCIWIILLLFCCGGNGNGILGGCGNNCDNDCGCNNNNNCCEWIIWILLISCFCGNNNGCGCYNGCC